MKKIIIITILITIIVLSGCQTSNIKAELTDFCEERNPDSNTYRASVELELKNRNYNDTKVKCTYYKSAWIFEKKTLVFNISCTSNTTCSKTNDWGECTSHIYDYKCIEKT